jgi:hypothetical protein
MLCKKWRGDAQKSLQLWFSLPCNLLYTIIFAAPPAQQHQADRSRSTEDGEQAHSPRHDGDGSGSASESDSLRCCLGGCSAAGDDEAGADPGAVRVRGLHRGPGQQQRHHHHGALQLPALRPGLPRPQRHRQVQQRQGARRHRRYVRHFSFSRLQLDKNRTERRNKRYAVVELSLQPAGWASRSTCRRTSARSSATSTSSPASASRPAAAASTPSQPSSW